MIISDVMEELGDALRTISGLQVFAYPGDSPTPPAAVVRFPEDIDYDGTFGNGMERITLLIDVITAPVLAASAPSIMSPYVTSSGPASVKAALEGYSGYSDLIVRAESATFDQYLIGDIQYLTAVFTVDVVGPAT